MQLNQFPNTFIEKNRIIFLKDNKQYHANLNGDDRLNVFCRDLMNVFLEQYEQLLNLIVTYDDIISIFTNENTINTLDDLPTNLKELRMISSMCTTLILPNTLEYIHINKSNLTEMPDISHCTKLKHCIINMSNLTKCKHTIPKAVTVLNLQNNYLTQIDEKYFINHIVLGENTFNKSFQLNLNGNRFNRSEQPVIFQNNC